MRRDRVEFLYRRRGHRRSEHRPHGNATGDGRLRDHSHLDSPDRCQWFSRYLADVSTRPNVTLRIHPCSAGYTHGILHGSFVLLDFGTDHKGRPIEPPVVYLDGGMSSDLYLERPELVQRYTEMADAIRETALDEKTTRDLLRRAARSFDGDR
ncbi:Scr1 family TA system antitoxin-like transcriptional regulator [Nocardia gipuzkoensis]